MMPLDSYRTDHLERLTRNGYFKSHPREMADSEFRLDTVSINPHTEIKICRRLTCRKIFFTDRTEFSGDIVTNLFQQDTLTRINGRVSASEMFVNGRLIIFGNIRARNLIVRGSLYAPVDIRAEEADFLLSEYCTCKTLTARTITVKQPVYNDFLRLFFNPDNSGGNVLYADKILGDDLNLAGVTANLVQGSRVRIGPGCRIRKVVYRDAIYIDKKACVDWYEPYTPKEGGPNDVVQ